MMKEITAQEFIDALKAASRMLSQPDRVIKGVEIWFIGDALYAREPGIGKTTYWIGKTG